MKFANYSAIGLGLAAAFVGTLAKADAINAPSAYRNTAGYEYQSSIFGNGSTNAVTFQEGFATADLGGLTPGSFITGIGYRLPTNLPTVSIDTSYTDFTVQIGTSSVATGSLSTSAIANQGADTITARTGAFTLPGGSLINTGGLNPFYTIAFTTPYLYQGGDLLVTTAYSVTGTVPFIGVDAVDPFGTVNTLGGNDPSFLHTHLFNAPIVQFTTAAAVPEISTWLMLVAGFGIVGGALRSGRRAIRVTA